MATPEVKPEDKDNKDTLLDELDNLDNDETPNANADEDETPNADADETPNDDDEVPEENIVDMFIKGDMDAVKAHIHDRVVFSVSDVINQPEVLDDDEETDD